MALTSLTQRQWNNIIKNVIRSQGVLMSLNHEKNALDWVHHFIIKYKTELDKANRILIEQQPPHGLQHIELLLIKEYRSKITNIYPRAFHTWMLFNNNISYEDRKKIIVARAEPYLKDMPSWSKNTDRQHDMADALCFILMYTHKEVKQVTPIYNNEFNKIIESFSYDP